MIFVYLHKYLVCYFICVLMHSYFAVFFKFSLPHACSLFSNTELSYHFGYFYDNAVHRIFARCVCCCVMRCLLVLHCYCGTVKCFTSAVCMNFECMPFYLV